MNDDARLERPDLGRYMRTLRLDASELARRRAFFELRDDDLARLAALRPFAERHTHAIIDDFYALLLEHPQSKGFFPHEGAVERVKRTQREYFLGLFEGRCDLAYVEDRLRVGVAHERIGVPPVLYLGAYRRYLHLILHYLAIDVVDAAKVREAFASVQKLVYFDVSLAMETYAAASLEAIERHRAAIRELSTPVIRVQERVLLLPLVGAIDSVRADHVMEAVLRAVTGEQARVIIIDIAGVPVVDTRVADHLLKTTDAVRLLGARTILTGISASVARTMVQLGVDVSTMQTVNRLSDGIELALALAGEQGPRKAEPPQGR